MPDSLLWAPLAWLPGGWSEAVVLRIDAAGRWDEITPGIATPPLTATRVAGPLLPGLVDAHSHAFQRAFVGLAEQRESAADDFWSWRDRMYRVALRITSAQLRAVATQLYVELLRGGYTQACEFHYLHHDVEGKPYDDPLALSWALADAAADAGIGLTVLPALYERAGFSQPMLRDDQRRFAASADWVWQAAQRLATARRPLLTSGVAIHSLRAAAPASVAALRTHAIDWHGPIHLHVSEQTAEVDECVAMTGVRPVEWLAREGLLDSRWQLVHATHTTRDEIAAVARSGAGIVVCPSTEGNLGDGLADVVGWLASDVPVAIGSDSHVTRDWREELRWLEYGQRLLQHRRNVAAAPERGHPSTAARLFDAAVTAGAAVAAEPRWGLVEGARADALVVDPDEPNLLGVPADRLLDALVFSSPARAWRDVMVAGQWVIRDGRHARESAIVDRFRAAMEEIWSAL
jgi:formimidoylglutamate deiminase